MNLERKIIEIEQGKEFFVSKEIKREDKIYLYIIDIKQPKNTNFYELINEKIFPVTDNDVLKELLFEVVQD